MWQLTFMAISHEKCDNALSKIMRMVKKIISTISVFKTGKIQKRIFQKNQEKS